MWEDDAALTEAVRAAQAGDETAFLAVFRAAQPRLLGYLCTLTDEADAEGVAAEAWQRMSRELDSFCGDGAGFRRWSAAVTRDCALHRPRPERPAGGGAVSRLPREQAEAVVLRLIVGLDAQQTAEVLGTSRRAARVLAHQGLCELAALLDRPGDGATAPATSADGTLCTATWKLEDT